MRPVLSPGAEVVEFEVRLRGVVPTVWRRFQIPAAASLADLHEVLQVVMGWTNSHLHEFRVDGRRFGRPDPDPEWDDGQVADHARTTVAELVGLGTRIVYRYDFGDQWLHDLTVHQVAPAEPFTRYPRCLDGARACPPEDVGGDGGYEEFLAAVGDPSHPEHAGWLEWSGPFDPARFDPAAADWALTRLAWRPAASTAPRLPAPGTTPIVLRCTGKFLNVLRPAAKKVLELPPSPQDWYGNLVWIDGRKCVLVTHAETLFSVFLPDVRVADLRPIGAALVPAIRAELSREGLPADTFGHLDEGAVQLAKTADRRVLGAMRDLALRCELAAADDGGLAALDLADLHRSLQRHIVGARGAVYAIDLVRARVGLDPIPPSMR